MTRSKAPTNMSTVANRIVLVGGDHQLTNACKMAALATSGAALITCTQLSAATTAADARPFAVVVPKAIYDSQPGEYEALTRDLQAELVITSDATEQEELERRLIVASKRMG